MPRRGTPAFQLRLGEREVSADVLDTDARVGPIEARPESLVAEASLFRHADRMLGRDRSQVIRHAQRTEAVLPPICVDKTCQSLRVASGAGAAAGGSRRDSQRALLRQTCSRGGQQRHCNCDQRLPFHPYAHQPAIDLAVTGYPTRARRWERPPRKEASTVTVTRARINARLQDLSRPGRSRNFLAEHPAKGHEANGVSRAAAHRRRQGTPRRDKSREREPTNFSGRRPEAASRRQKHYASA